jgi:hypothetical protein
MKYEQVLELLPDYVKGRLDDALAAKVRAEVQGSSSLQREYDSLKRYFGTLSGLEEIKAPGDFVNRVNAAINTRRGPAGLLSRLFFPLHVKLPLEAAGLVVSVLLVIMVFNPLTLKNAPPEALKQAPAAQTTATASADETVDFEEYAPTEREKRERSKGDGEAAKGHDATRERPRPTLSAPSPAPPAVQPVDEDRPAVKERVDELGKAQPRGGHGYTDDMVAGSVPASSPRPAAKRARAPSAAPAASPAPEPRVAMAADKAMAESEAPGENDMSLQRRELREEREAMSVMELVINDRDIDDNNVKDSRRSKSKKAEGAAQGSGGFLYDTKAHKAWGIVERSVRSHGGSFRVRSTVLSPTPRREYTISIPAARFEGVRVELRALGVLRDIDLNLDASSAQRISFKLSVTVE